MFIDYGLNGNTTLPYPPQSTNPKGQKYGTFRSGNTDVGPIYRVFPRVLVPGLIAKFFGGP